MHIRSMVYRVQYLNQSISKDKLGDFFIIVFLYFFILFSFFPEKEDQEIRSQMSWHIAKVDISNDEIWRLRAHRLVLRMTSSTQNS